MKRKSFRGLASALKVGALSAIVVTGRGHAATFTKSDNTTALDQAGSWGGTAPGNADLANWSGTYNTAGSLAAGLPGSALTWQGITVGSLAGAAAGTVSIGGTGAPMALSVLTVGGSGINLTGASQDLVINAETFHVSGSQTWTLPAGRNLRFGSNVATAKVDGAGGNATVVTVTGGGTLDGNQGATNGFANYTGKWVVAADTMLRGIGTGTVAWGSNTAADAITLKGGTLAVGAISGTAGTISWPSPITLGALTSSRISRQYAGADIAALTLAGTISGDGNLAIDKLAGTSFTLRVDRVDNTYTGTTSINSGTSGTLTVAAHLGTAAGSKTPFGTGAISVTGTSGAATILEFTTTALSASSSAESIVPNHISLDTATLSSREGLLRLDGNLNLTGANTIQGQVDLKDITINGLIEGTGSVNFRAIGTQKIKLSGANTYSGGTILGSNSASVGVVVLGNANSLGTGAITARGMQIWSDVDNLVLTNNILVGNSLTLGGGLCFGGAKNISLTGAITLTDNSSRQFQNSGTGMITLSGISMTGTSGAIARFNEASTTQGTFTVAGPVTGLGQVQIRGGIVTLAGANTYTGNTTVSNAGRLNLTGSLTSNVSMTAAGAALMGGGSTTKDLTVSAGTIYLDPTNPTVAISAANVAITGTAKVELLAPQPLGTTTYTVLNYTGTFTGLDKLSTAASRGTFSAATPGTLTFAASSETRTWNAAASSVWNTITDPNWAEGDQKFYAGDAVVFGNTGAGSLSIAGVVRPLSATFNNATGSDYTLTSTAGNQIGGAGGLEKAGTGTLTLVGPNIFTGKTTLSGGTLVIRADAALGTAPAAPVADQLTLAGGTLKLAPDPVGAITLNANRGITLAAGVSTLDTTAVGNGFTATLPGETAGAGELVILANGDTSLTGGGVPGSTHLSGTSLRTGNTTIKSGVVAIESGFGDPNAVVILDGGGLVDRNLNVAFTQPLQVGPAGGILRSYGNATTTFAGPISNAPGVGSASLTHTDGGTQTFNGDGSAFQGTYTNARGNANFDSANWAGLDLVNTDGDIVRFRSGTTTRVNSVTIDRDLHIEQNTTLDVVSGAVTVAPGVATQNFWIQNTGTLTSSSGTLTFDFKTPYTTAGAEDQSVRVLIADNEGGKPVTVVKTGPGAINTFDQPNTYTGGTIINGGKINVTTVLALGTGPVTVNSGGQASLTAANGFYGNDFTIAGVGPADLTPGAIRFANNSVSGTLTVAAAGARVVADAGTTGGITGTLAGTGNLELNSPAAGHTGTFNLSADASTYSGTLTLAQGTLNLTGSVGSSVVAPTGTTLAGEGAINGTLTLGGTLRVAGASPEALTVNNLAVPGPCLVQLDSLPVPLGPITLVNYTAMTGAVANFQNAPGSIRRLAFTDTGSAIMGEVINATRTWTGAANGNWDSTSLNWVEGDQKFIASDSVVFNNSGATKTILISNPVSPSAVLFDNSAGNDYTVTGRMVVSNGGALVKQGTGTVTLAGTQSNVTGAVRIDGGTLVLATTDYQIAVGASTGIEINAGGALRLNGINILGNGVDSNQVTVNPGGVVELNAFHTHFRALNLKGGAVLGTRPAAERYNDEYAAFDALVTVSGSQMSTIGSADGGTGSYSLNGGTFDVGETATGTDLLVSAPLSLNILTKGGPGTMTLTANNRYTGNTVINNGVLDLAANGIYRDATGEAAYDNVAVITVNATGTLKLKSFTYNGDGGTGGLADYAARRVLNGGTIEVTGPTHSSGNDFTVTATGGTFRYHPAVTTNTLTLAGNANTNLELGGILTCDTVGNLTIGEIMAGTGAVRKTSAGSLTLNAANTYSGMTTVVAGALKGTGSIAGGLTVNATGTIAPGAGVGTFTVSGPTSLAGTYACEISGAAADRLTVTGNLTIAASGAALAFATVGAPTATSYVIASYTGTFSGNLANLTVTGLPAGYSVTHDAGAKQIKLVGSPSGYNTWATANGIGGESPAADHDQDGIPNAVEWVLGGNPNGPDTNKLPLATSPAGDFVFSFKRAQASKTADTSVAIEVGTTLTAWPSLYTVGNTTAGSTAGVTVTDNGDGTDTVTLTVTRAPHASKFARLTVTIN